MARRIIPDFIENPHNLSGEEFTRRLCIWFEDQGMMSEVRTHLRSLMITSLKGTPLGPKAVNVGSPKCQAINLMVAEFLIEHQYHYTLSVFSSEVPLKDFSTLTVGNLAANKEDFADTENGARPRYQERFVKDILETLGFSPHSEESRKIIRFYYENQEGLSLIMCIFIIISELLRSRQGIPKQVNEKNNFMLDTPVRDTDDLMFKDHSTHSNNNFEGTDGIFNSEMQNIITLSALKTEHIHKLQNELKKCIQLEVSKVQQEEESKYRHELIKREKNIQENLDLRETFVQQLIEDSNLRIENERQEIVKERREMKELAAQLRERHCQLVARCTELEDWGQSLKSKELEIEEMKHQETLRAAEKNCQLDFRKHQIDLEFERLQKEHEELDSLRQGVIELKRSLENAHQNLAKEAPSIYNLQEECIYLRKQLDSARNLLKKKTSNTAEKESQQLIEEKPEDKSLLQKMLVTKELCRQLQQENGELRARTRQQDRRIEELTSRAAELVTKLEDARTVIIHQPNQEIQASFPGNLLGSHLIPTSSVDYEGFTKMTDPVAPLAPLMNQQRVKDRQRMGAGEESPYEFNLPETKSHVSRSVQTKEQPRKKLHRRTAFYTQISSDESSPTEEILVEAKRRLRSLEEESEAVDKKFRAFRERQHVPYISQYSSQHIAASYLHYTASSNHINVNQQHRLGKSVPTLSNANGRKVYYHQPEVYTQSRLGRMTDLQSYSSTDTIEDSVIISQLSPVSSRIQNFNLVEEQPVKHSSPPATEQNIQSKLHSPPPSSKIASLSKNENATSIQSSIQLNARSYDLSPPPQTRDTNTNLKVTSVYSTPQVSHSVEVPRQTNPNREKSSSLTENLDHDFSVKSPDLRKKSDEGSPTKPSAQKSNKFDKSDSILVYMNAAPARHSSDSEENPHPLINRPPIVLNPSTSKTIADIARENAERSQEQKVPEPLPSLEHPESRLKPLNLESKGTAELFSSTVRDPNATLSANTSAEVKKLKSVTALSGTTSGSGLESLLPALQNVSLSSIELSSDHPVSDANSKGKGSNSEDDFWA